MYVSKFLPVASLGIHNLSSNSSNGFPVATRYSHDFFLLVPATVSL